jgi:hypothetical protein
VHRPRSLVYVILIQTLSFFVIVIGGTLYINHVDEKRAEAERKQDQQWCELIVTFDEAYRSSPPSSETARKIQELMHRRRETLGC